MTGKFVLVLIALSIGAFVINEAPTWTVAAVVLAVAAMWCLLALDRKWEKERRRKPLEPVKGRRG